MTFRSLYEAKWQNEIGDIEDIFDKFLRVESGALELSSCSDNERKLIEAFSENPTIKQFLFDTKNGFSTAEEATDYIKNHGSIVVELLNVVIKDPALTKSLGITKDFLPKIIENIDSDDVMHLENEEIGIKEYARINQIDTDTDEIGLTMLLNNKLTPENSAAAEAVEKDLNNMEKKLTDSMNNSFLIGCLTTDPKSRLMWSHYADGHKGFCIEYDFEQLKKSCLPFPIIYSQSRPQIPWKAVIDRSMETMTAATTDLIFGLLTKDKDWEYENEWRILIPADNPHELKVPITAVYLGANISPNDKKRIIKIARKKKIPVKQMSADRGAYDLHAENVIDFGANR